MLVISGRNFWVNCVLIIKVLVEFVTHGRIIVHFMTHVDDFDQISTIYGRFQAGFGLVFLWGMVPAESPRAGPWGKGRAP